MFNKEPVTFSNKDRNKLFGILHKPTGDIVKDTAIIILSPGVKSRVAPHRLYINMAQRYADMGFNVLRFDFYGLGDSEGEVQEKYMADFYGTVQVGRYIDDTISAMDWMEKELNIHRFIIAGLCGGAITGLLAGTVDKRVDSLLGLGIPVILDSVNISKKDYLTSAELDRYREGYLAKLTDLKSLVRMLSFKSDYKTIIKALLNPIKKRFMKQSDKKEIPLSNETAGNDCNFNNLFPKAFHDMLSSSKKIFLIFGEYDHLYPEFNEKFMKPYKHNYDKFSSYYEVHTVKSARHIYEFLDDQKDMLNQTCSWLAQNYPEEIT